MTKREFNEYSDPDFSGLLEEVEYQNLDTERSDLKRLARIVRRFVATGQLSTEEFSELDWLASDGSKEVKEIELHPDWPSSEEARARTGCKVEGCRILTQLPHPHSQ